MKNYKLLYVLLFIFLSISIFGSSLSAEHSLKIINNTRLYKEASLNSPVILILQKGVVLTGTKVDENWYKVVYNRKEETDGAEAKDNRVIAYIQKDFVLTLSSSLKKTEKRKPIKKIKKKKKDKIFLMGMGMIRANWTKVQGDEFRFRSSDLGLPSDLSTRERASFMVDGTFGNGKYDIKGNLNYDPETRVTEPPLDFLLTIGNDRTKMTIGDNRSGVFLDSLFTRYMHPFRGISLQLKSKFAGAEFVIGLARGETGLDEIPTSIGAGPYSLEEAPVLRGSEIVFLIVKSQSNPDNEIKRIRMVRNSDYYIDYDRGDLVFAYPLYSTDDLGNPQYLVVKYQYESIAGSFTRGVGGIKAFIYPFNFLKLNFSYIADMDKSIDFSDAVKNRRGIYSLGLEIDSKKVNMFTEFSKNDEAMSDNQYAFFGGGVINFSKKLHLFLNSWQVDPEFPTFANRQLEYGFNLFQVYPAFSMRNIFLSPFQFTRNLGTQLFPFTLLGLSVDEKESSGFLEWDDKENIINFGYGRRDKISEDLKNRTFYLSAFRDKGKYQVWGKFQGETSFDENREDTDLKVNSYLAGWRQRLIKNSKGGLFFQLDYSGTDTDDFLNLQEDSFRHSSSVSIEYLKESEGIFGAYRKDILIEKDSGRYMAEVDIFELGLKYHFVKNFFIDSRYRDEKSKREGIESTSNLISLGLGYEAERFRGLARYEIQINEADGKDGRRELWSLFLFGSPVKRMSLSLKYYKRKGRDIETVFLSERSEEQLSIRLLYKPVNSLTLYSQWRYDINAELAPPLDEMKSNSLASIQGIKYKFFRKFEFLANYKLLKIWGPIENRKESYSAEIGYLIHKNFRFGIGYEVVNFSDGLITENNYNSNTGYFKLVAIF